ncbi:MAG TPA: NAD(P)/FAD-dependent oxidoreductase [Niabella sp.]|nr:NAD(P)/FAD-dependent oxidoreductase [Chitinophagaceae bacterium]HRO85635.1 NAD(P)/FAD-dependent oxidoreductase [Niabella sp.]
MKAGKSLIVIGGGAAGFFCAVNVARLNPDLSVTILEKTGKLLSKVKVSGGGRCNVTHSCFDINEMTKGYPRGGSFVKKIFHQFFTTDTINWYKERGVELKAEADGRMFPVTNSSQTIIDCLLQEAGKYKVAIKMHHEVNEIFYKNDKFGLKIKNGLNLEADYLCIAAGGFSKMNMHEWLIKAGHSISAPVPSLFTFNMPKHPITKLMGVTVGDVSLKMAGTKLQQRGPVLITHWGLSGPCVLRLSAWAAREVAEKNWQFAISINWVSQYNETTLRALFQEWRLKYASQKVFFGNSLGLPKRLWEFLLLQSNIDEKIRWAELPAKQQNLLVKNLLNYECEISGKTTFKEEFVTAGGIKLTEIDHNTMMSKKVPNLFFAGEIIDVDGITGGFNFQNAWTTGYVAAKNIAANFVAFNT